jgi:hypothetical protein
METIYPLSQISQYDLASSQNVEHDASVLDYSERFVNGVRAWRDTWTWISSSRPGGPLFIRSHHRPHMSDEQIEYFKPEEDAYAAVLSCAINGIVEATETGHHHAVVEETARVLEDAHYGSPPSFYPEVMSEITKGVLDKMVEQRAEPI